jgi:DNA polymerase epsilon subunit 2
MFRQRYHIVHQRILRDPEFDSHPLTGRKTLNGSGSSPNKITPISNLLGRTRTRHLLLGLLQVLPTGQLAISDLSGSIILDMSSARPLPAPDAAWFCPGMLLLVEGVYVEEHGDGVGGIGGSSSSEAALGTLGGVGATIGGRFIVGFVAHPPCERRSTTLSLKETDDEAVDPSVQPPEAFGWTDFLGVGSSKATGVRMRKLLSKLLSQQPALPDGSAQQLPNRRNSSKIIIASNLLLDQPNTLSSLRLLLSHYDAQPVGSTPLAFVLMGNFLSAPALAGTLSGSSVAYKEAFNGLASVMSDFPNLVARSTWVFVPGDHDAWPSSFSGGSATVLPRKGVPGMFTGRVGRVVAEANREVRRKEGASSGGKEGEVVWASNPSRLTWFGVAGEMVLFRDDITGRLRRNAIRFPKLDEDNAEKDDTTMAGADQADNQNDGYASTTEPTTNPKTDNKPDPDLLSTRRLTKSLLDQGHLSPFPISIRPIHWDYSHVLSLYPLPSALVIADSEAPRFSVMYNGSCVINPGSIVEGRRGERGGWIEYDVLTRRGEVKIV